MVSKKFLPKNENDKKRFNPIRTVIASVLIAVLLISTSVGLGFSRFRLVSKPLTTVAKTTGLRVDNSWAVVKERVSGEDTVFSFLDGDIKVTVPASAEGEALDSAKYLVLTHKDYKPSYSEEDGYKIKFTLSAYRFADPDDDTASAVEEVTDNNGSMSIAFDVESEDGSVDDESTTAGYTDPDEYGWLVYEDISSFSEAAYQVKFASDETSDKWIDEADTSWYNVDETSFSLQDEKALAGLAKLVNEGTDFGGCNLTLESNVDLSGKKWTPIGTASHPFKGTFDGNGKTIASMSVTSAGDETSAGLFGTIDGATIKGVHLSNASISADLGMVGSAVYPAQTPDFDGSAIGLAAGRSIGGSIQDVHVTSSTITGKAKFIGGILGSGGASVSSCSFESASSISPGSAVIIGGIAGALYSDISGCYVSATLNGSVSSACGGIVGLAANGAGSMSKCYFTGTLNEGGSSCVAGLLAVADASISSPYAFNDCFADTDIENKVFGTTNSNYGDSDAISSDSVVDWKNSAEGEGQKWSPLGSSTEYVINHSETSFASGLTYSEFLAA